MTTPTPRTDALLASFIANSRDAGAGWENCLKSVTELARDLEVEWIARGEALNISTSAHIQLLRDLAAAKEARQRAEERAQAWREKTHAAEDVALAALASFALTQSVDDYPEDHWSHKAERIRTIRAAIDAAREGKL